MNNETCTLCKNIPAIKINILNYCKMCFEKQLESKVLRNLNNLPYKSKILIVLHEDVYDNILLYFLNRLKNKKMHEFIIFNPQNKDFGSYNFFQVITQNSIENLPNIDINNQTGNFNIDILNMLQKSHLSFHKILINYKINVVLYCKSMEDICTDLIIKVSSGVVLDKTDVCDYIFQDSCTFINMFKDIKNKEIQYMSYLQSYKFNCTGIKNKKYKSINKFINEINKNNPLALYNIINVVKKINKRI